MKKIKILLLIMMLGNLFSPSHPVIAEPVYTELGGIVRGELWLTADKSPYLLTSNLQIDTNGILHIGPGVLVNGDDKKIEVWGTVTSVDDSRKSVFNRVVVDLKWAIDDPNSPTFEVFNMDLLNSRIESWSRTSIVSIKNSLLYNCDIRLYSLFDKFVFENNSFYQGQTGSSVWISKHYDNDEITLSIQNNHMSGNPIEYTNPLIDLRYFSFGNTQYTIANNSLYSSGLIIRGHDTVGPINISMNYWNNLSTQEIENKIYDRNDDLNIKGIFDYEPTLAVLPSTLKISPPPKLHDMEIERTTVYSYPFNENIDIKTIQDYGLVVANIELVPGQGSEDNDCFRPVSYSSFDGTYSLIYWCSFFGEKIKPSYSIRLRATDVIGQVLEKQFTLYYSPRGPFNVFLPTIQTTEHWSR